MEANKQYTIYAFEAKDNTIRGKYLVAADDLEAAKKYVYNINHTVSPVEIDINSGIEFKNLKYICPDYNSGIDAICVINALNYPPY